MKSVQRYGAGRIELKYAMVKTTEAPESAKRREVMRAIGELRRGDPVILRDLASAAVMFSAESLDDAQLSLARTLAIAGPNLVMTSWRAAAAGLAPAPGADRVLLELRIPAGSDAAWVRERVDPTIALTLSGGTVGAIPTDDGFAATAVDLTRFARLLPAAIIAPLSRSAADGFAEETGAPSVTVQQVFNHRTVLAHSLHRVADAEVPLAGAEQAKVVAFRPEDGGVDHLAILIGDPQPPGPVLVRVHSECFTGDLLGSLRCDCGDQLRGAIQAIADAGSGILLYLAQEGRGIGLVNKLRAYTLQDAGLDTVDANLQLGYGADERMYQPAAEILRQLDFDRIRLMTNNPEKVAALQRCGITVTERVPHSFPANGHNEAYLLTKAQRSGHLL